MNYLDLHPESRFKKSSVHLIHWLSFLATLHICFRPYFVYNKPLGFWFELIFICHFGAFYSWLCGKVFVHCWRSTVSYSCWFLCHFGLLWRIISLAIISHLLLLYHRSLLLCSIVDTTTKSSYFNLRLSTNCNRLPKYYL